MSLRSDRVRRWRLRGAAGLAALMTGLVSAGGAPLTAALDAALGRGSARVQVTTLAGLAGEAGFLAGQGAAARFNTPWGLAVDAIGNVFVSDAGNHAIRRIGTDGRVTMVAGTGRAGHRDGDGSVAMFNWPNGLALAPDGSALYVADQRNERIRRVVLEQGADPTDGRSWRVHTIAGTGQAGNRCGPGSLATLGDPPGVCCDARGTLYITEGSGNRVRRLQWGGGDPNQASNWFVSPLAGDLSVTYGAKGSQDGPGWLARFDYPVGIAVDVAGNLLVTEFGNTRVRRIAADGTVSTVAGSTKGYLDAASREARFGKPWGLCSDAAGYLYVADADNQRLRRIGPDGAVTTVAGTGPSGGLDGSGEAATFGCPASLAWGPDGTLYVASFVGHTVRAVRPVPAGPAG